uniref:Alpha-type protein kinase domain-containing protein n=1 Tax=Parascaris univalens TaxID=6257 RepID=A0A915C9A2_PARUN
MSESNEQVVSAKIGSEHSSSDIVRSKELISKWRDAAKRCYSESLPDPWEQFRLTELATRNCIRHRYSPIRKQWCKDCVQVKMQREPFARGAMRECYRLKKLSAFRRNDQWEQAQNYVAKKYIRLVDRQVVFEDVKLQMDSKLWAEEFNRHNPPKKVDIMQVSVLEFTDEAGCPLYHLEHYIEGDYVKYNSNSGFVSDITRNTPQAFSHFTFERSGHQLIVVDIQGVGDLYTDPQIHTASGKGYGDGNLGTKGMALFFHSHACNEICRLMCLTKFDLSDGEKRGLYNKRTFESGSTRLISCNSSYACEPLTNDDYHSAMERLRSRSVSICSSGGFAERSVSVSSCDGVSEADSTGRSGICPCEACAGKVMRSLRRIRLKSDAESASVITDFNDDEMRIASFDRCPNVDTTSSCCSSRHTREAEREAFWLEARKFSRPAGFLSQNEVQQLAELSMQSRVNSVLGQIHVDLARYHELGRFLPKSVSASKDINFMSTDEDDHSNREGSFVYDKQAALYHLDMARRCGIVEAIITIAEIAYGLPHELLKDITDADYWGYDDPEELGMELMETAAEMGDRTAMLLVAESYETGRRLGRSRSPYWPKAVNWYSRAADFSEDSEDGTEGFISKPKYEIVQKIAEMHREGGCGLEQDFAKAYELFTEAAKLAAEAMRGKVANKLYEMAEQCAI